MPMQSSTVFDHKNIVFLQGHYPLGVIMDFKNTANHYGSIAKYLHWGTAVLFLASYISVYYRHWFTEEKTPENWTALGHL
jgi:uncharacterized membrane protein YjfL (UPF0719 family)